MTKGEKFWLCLTIMAIQAQNLQLLYDKLEGVDNPYYWVGSLMVIGFMAIFIWLTGKSDG